MVAFMALFTSSSSMANNLITASCEFLNEDDQGHIISHERYKTFEAGEFDCPLYRDKCSNDVVTQSVASLDLTYALNIAVDTTGRHGGDLVVSLNLIRQKNGKASILDSLSFADRGWTHRTFTLEGLNTRGEGIRCKVDYCPDGRP